MHDIWLRYLSNILQSQILMIFEVARTIRGDAIQVASIRFCAESACSDLWKHELRFWKNKLPALNAAAAIQALADDGSIVGIGDCG